MSLPALTFPESQSTFSRFRAFHEKNPDVYAELVRLARDAKAQGAERVGIRMIWEVMRWNLTVRTKRAEGDFKLNDHYTSRYARKIMRENPDLDGVFDVRELRS